MEMRHINMHAGAVDAVQKTVSGMPDSVGMQGHFVSPNKVVSALGITPGMKVADFGSGAGVYSLLVASLVGSSGKVYAIDVQRELLNKLKNTASTEGLNNIEIVWGDFDQKEGSKLKEESIHMVLISNALFQSDDRPGAVREAYRVLMPGGTLVIVDWSESFGGMGPQKENVVTKAAALSLCGDAGFTLVREFDAGEHHYGLILRKPQQRGGRGAVPEISEMKEYE